MKRTADALVSKRSNWTGSITVDRSIFLFTNPIDIDRLWDMLFQHVLCLLFPVEPLLLLVFVWMWNVNVCCSVLKWGEAMFDLGNLVAARKEVVYWVSLLNSTPWPPTLSPLTWPLVVGSNRSNMQLNSESGKWQYWAASHWQRIRWL